MVHFKSGLRGILQHTRVYISQWMFGPSPKVVRSVEIPFQGPIFIVSWPVDRHVDLTSIARLRTISIPQVTWSRLNVSDHDSLQIRCPIISPNSTGLAGRGGRHGCSRRRGVHFSTPECSVRHFFGNKFITVSLSMSIRAFIEL